MTAPLKLTFSGGEILRQDGLSPDVVHVADGVITDVPGRAIDVSGYLVLPGIVDLHGDGFERHLAPRRGALESLDAGLKSLDRELAANGITTAVLAQFVSWEGGMRGPGRARALAHVLPGAGLQTDARLQLRIEIGFREAFGLVRDLVSDCGVRYVVFNDHLPHDALAAGRTPPRLSGQALKAGRSPEAHRALLERLHSGMPEARDEARALASDLAALGVRIGSHDDHAPEDRAAWRAIGADLSEFPETRAAAEAAHAAGEPVVMGAPNVVRGGSHDGKVSARDLVADGLVDALASDYHYPAPHTAAFALWRGGLDLAAAWALVSDGPARVMGWADRGRIAGGMRADLVFVRRDTLVIEGTMTAGRFSYLSGGLAARAVG